jgi:hypothetical protein
MIILGLSDLDLVGLIFLIILVLITLLNVFTPLWMTIKTLNKEIPENHHSKISCDERIKYIWYAGLAGTKIKGDLDYYDLHDEVDHRNATEKDSFPNFSPNYGFVLRTTDNSGKKIVVYGEVMSNLKTDNNPQKQLVVFIGNIICEGKMIHRTRTVDGDICPNQIS